MSKKKKIIYTVLLVVIIVAGCIGFYFVTQNMRYLKTDNAKVTADMVTLRPVTSGKLLEWNVEEGDIVKKNQVLGRQQVLPYITSPMDGQVVQSNYKQDQLVSPETSLAVIADTSHMYIGVNIEETEINKIKVGQQVDISIDAYPGKEFQGVVEEIDNTTQTYFAGTSSFSTSGTFTKVTQLIPVKVSIKNPEKLPMKLGMNATVKIHLQ